VGTGRGRPATGDPAGIRDANKVNAIRVDGITPEELLYAKQAVRRHVRDSAELHEMYLMLDLYEPGSPRREPGPQVLPRLAHNRPLRTKGKHR
jgi:hypothetical protein